MGVYELMEGMEVNGRGVWQAAGGEENFMYYAKRNTPDDKRWHWFVSDRKYMEAGKGAGWMKVASTALTPDQVTETWQVTGKGWLNAPKVRARMCSAEEKRTAAEKLQHAMAAARQVRDIRRAIWWGS
jgi:hypothetical protein